jgi:hypothetical protein
LDGFRISIQGEATLEACVTQRNEIMRPLPASQRSFVASGAESPGEIVVHTPNEAHALFGGDGIAYKTADSDPAFLWTVDVT